MSSGSGREKRVTMITRRRTATVAATLVAMLAAGMSGAPAEKAVAADTNPTENPATPALSMADARIRAAKSGEPVEVVSLRDERSTTVANPDGTFTSSEYVQPVRVRKSGVWTDIDTTLVEQKNGTLAPAAALTAMSFSGGGDTTFAEIEKDGRTLALNWPDKLPEPKTDGPTATYTNVLPGVDLKVTASAEGFSHVLVVKSAEAAANPELARLELPVDTSSLELSETSDGGLAATDSGAGGDVFEAPQPVMWDSSKGAVPEPSVPETAEEETITPPDGAQVADVAVDLTPGTMTLNSRRGMLADADTVYPVYIDPVVKTVNRSGWTMVSSHYSTAEFWKFGDDEGLGRCPSDVSYRCSSNSDVKR